MTRETRQMVSLADTELACAQVSTIRLKLLKIGVLVQTSVRRIVLHLSGNFPLRNLLHKLLSHLAASEPPTPSTA